MFKVNDKLILYGKSFIVEKIDTKYKCLVLKSKASENHIDIMEGSGYLVWYDDKDKLYNPYGNEIKQLKEG